MHQKYSVDGYRSFPHKRPVIGVAILTLLQYLSLIAIITLGVILIRVGDSNVKYAFAVALLVFIIVSVIGYFCRTTIKCPLCRGTPLLDTAASKHTKATRIPPLNFGTSAQFSILFSHRFRCMYCGTGFDLMRKSSSMRDQGEN